MKASLHLDFIVPNFKKPLNPFPPSQKDCRQNKISTIKNLASVEFPIKGLVQSVLWTEKI